VNAIGAIISRRRALLAQDGNIIAIRSSAMGPPRDSSLVRYDPPLYGSAGFGPANNVEPCFNYRQFTATRNRLTSIRCIPDDWEQDGHRTPEGIEAAPVFQAWLDALAAASFGLSTPDPANLITQNTSIISPDPQGNAVVIPSAAIAGLAYHDLVRIRTVRSNRLFNAVWRVSPAIGGISFTLLGSKPFYVFDTGPSSSQKISLITDPFVTYRFEGCGNRKTGRIFGVPRGRRPVQVSRR
jgi:hypothetical protein